MTRDEFATKLRDGVVTFAFRKKDGSERAAKGTLKMDLIPADKRPKGESGAQSESTGSEDTGPQKYYDLDSNGWRSFVWANFIGIR